MAYLAIEPRYRAVLNAHGLSSARAILEWSGVILSGHPRRHVLRVRVGDESFILKKEHHVPWRDRLASAWVGYGWASKSRREARVLEQLRAAGVSCPEVAAVGEYGAQAFLLLREEGGMTELRTYLAEPRAIGQHQALARALGRELARIHAAGFTQPDLYAKHILIRPVHDGFEFCFLDWQRSRPMHRVTWRRRVRDLAALDASLSAELVPVRLRLLCLRAYLRDAADHGVAPPRGVASAIRRLSERRQRQRKMREQRQKPLPAGAQQLLWLRDGERLCIVRDFFEELGGQLPSWLPQDPEPCRDGVCVEHRLILLGSGRTAQLVQRWSRTPLWMAEGKYPAPEFARAAMLFRLQRFGVAAPRLLAMGHHRVAAWQRFSFLLSEPLTGLTLAAVLAQACSPVLRQRLLRRLGSQLRQVHEAGFALRAGADVWQAWVVPDPEMPRVALADVEALERSNKNSQHRMHADLRTLLAANLQAGFVFSRADQLRITLGYVQRRRIDDGVRRLLAAAVPRERRVA